MGVSDEGERLLQELTETVLAKHPDARTQLQAEDPVTIALGMFAKVGVALDRAIVIAYSIGKRCRLCSEEPKLCGPCLAAKMALDELILTLKATVLTLELAGLGAAARERLAAKGEP